MKYLVTQNHFYPFFTNFYDYDNNYVSGMIIYNLENKTYTKDGLNWNKIEIDTL